MLILPILTSDLPLLTLTLLRTMLPLTSITPPSSTTHYSQALQKKKERLLEARVQQRAEKRTASLNSHGR